VHIPLRSYAMQKGASECYKTGLRSDIESHDGAGNENLEKRTVIIVPSFPAQGIGSAVCPGLAGTRAPSE
jgi:hypothetical protein